MYSCDTDMIFIHSRYMIDFFFLIPNFYTCNFATHICKITIKMITSIVRLIDKFTILLYSYVFIYSSYFWSLWMVWLYSQIWWDFFWDYENYIFVRTNQTWIQLSIWWKDFGYSYATPIIIEFDHIWVFFWLRWGVVINNIYQCMIKSITRIKVVKYITDIIGCRGDITLK